MREKSAANIIREFKLTPHPEGGYYREIYRDTPPDGGRGVVTAIYYLLEAGEISAWHRIDAVEMGHFYAGAPLKLSISADNKAPEILQLGLNSEVGEQPFHIVPMDVWQSAESTGAWTLVGCTVAPAFQFEGFEMAPEGWVPGA